MRKLFIALGAIAAMTSVAQADEWHRGFNPYNGYGHREWHGNRGGGDWVAPAIGGMIIGGALMEMSQPRYVAPQPVCQRVVTGQYWNGWQWVYRTQVVCQ